MRIELGTLTATPTADVTAKTFVGLDGETCAAAAKSQGVATFDIPADTPGPVQVLGVADVVAGGVVAAGGAVEADAAGKAVAHNAGVINGYARTAAAQAGDVIEVWLV